MKWNLKNLWEKDFVKTSFTIIATASITFLSSLLLIYPNLEAEQEYWTNRFIIETYQNEIKSKSQLLEKINTQILQTQVLADNFKLEAKYFDELVNQSKTSGIHIDLNKNELAKANLECGKQLASLAGTIQSIAFKFNSPTQSIVKQLSQKLEEYFNHNQLNHLDIDNTSTKFIHEDEILRKDVDSLRLLFIKEMKHEIDSCSSILSKVIEIQLDKL